MFLNVFAVPAFSATLTWTGAVDGKWSVAANWNPAVVPASGDALSFPDAVAQKNVENDLLAAFVAKSLQFAGDYTVSGNTVRFSEALSSNSCNLTFNIPVQAAGAQVAIGPASYTTLDINGSTATLSPCVPFAGEIIGTGTIHVPAGN